MYLALLSRLERYGRARMMVYPSPFMTQFVRQGTVFLPDVRDVGITERPPMIEVAEYRRRMGEPV